MNPLAVPIPPRMTKLPKDPRGYPIPVMVFRDESGRPHFTINGDGTRYMLAMEGQCSICGQPLDKGRWFVGGPLSAFHEHGTYYDPPLHRECMRYAMRVCPYLALASYTKRIDARTMTEDEPRRIYLDSAQDPTKPEVFVCVESIGQTIRQSPGMIQPVSLRPNRPYRNVEFWRHGRRLDRAEGYRIANRILETTSLQPQPQRTRVFRR